MFYLHVSNRTENLLRHLAEVLRADKQKDIFAKEMFLIQSQGMERMIAQTLATEFGSFCNFKFFMPLEFLTHVAEKLGLNLGSDSYERQTLTWRLDGLLRDIGEEVYQPLHSYLLGDSLELKRFQLARRLAHVFDQYQLMRPEMLEQWERGDPASRNPAAKWQMALWRRLLAQRGGEVHRSLLFGKVIERLAELPDLQELLPKRISVIGLHTLAPIFLQYLNNLSRHMDIHLMLLSPCRNYWGNVTSRRSQYRNSLLGKGQTGGALQPEEHHPLLAVLGRQGRDLQNLMLEQADFAMDFSSYEDPCQGDSPSEGRLLQRIQADLLLGRLRDSEGKNPIQDDDSIQVVSCHSKLREIEVLKDHLLRLLYKDPTLELRDIVVMAPDIQEYGSLIPAVFTDIQHSIADRSIRKRNSIINAFGKFLDLFSGRFGWSEIMDLLRNPSIREKLELTSTDLELLLQWITGSGIRWGLSAGQRAEEELPAVSATSWRAGLDRLLMGYAIDTEECVDSIYPYRDIEGKGALCLGGLCSFVELIETTRSSFKKERPLKEWASLLQATAGQLFGRSYGQEMMELRLLLTELLDVDTVFHSAPVSFRVICDWFHHLTKESRSSAGFLRGQLTFCSMLPMRSIPFKVVCLLGLSDTVFPRNDRHDTFDLMGDEYRAGDRSPRADDRYQFLEALLSARSHFYISYIGQSIRTNEEIPPSVVVTEFLEVLQDAYGREDLLVRHPLHPFSRKYFSTEGNPALFSYDEHYCKTAELLQRGAEPDRKWWQGRGDADGGAVLWEDLLKFFSHPQRYFVRNCLGIRLDLGEQLPDDRELFELLPLDRYHAEQQLLQALVGGKSEGTLERMQASGRWPLGSSGELSFLEKRLEVERFLERVEAQSMGEKYEELVLDITVGSFTLSGLLTDLYENGILLLRMGPLRGRDLLCGWLHHLVLSQLYPGKTTLLITLDEELCFSGSAKEPNLKTLLAHFMRGCLAPSPLLVEPALGYVKQEGSKRGKLTPLDKAEKIFRQRLEQGYEPEWELLYGPGGKDLQLGSEFENLCRDIMSPIVRNVDGSG